MALSLLGAAFELGVEGEEGGAVFVEEAAEGVREFLGDLHAVVVDQDGFEVAAGAGFDGDLIGGDRGAAENLARGPGVAGEDDVGEFGADDAFVALDVEVEIVVLADLREGAEEGGAGFVEREFAAAEDEEVVDVEEVIEGVELHAGAEGFDDAGAVADGVVVRADERVFPEVEFTELGLGAGPDGDVAVVAGNGFVGEAERGFFEEDVERA